MAGESKSVKLQKEDRISDLPDSVIHHILSFLPSTKESIRTTVLSKRWLNQWTQVPVLVFDNSGMSDENFSSFIDNTLLVHDCSKIEKFQVQGWADPHFYSKLRIAIRKNVEELLLVFEKEVQMPDFLFHHASLVKLQIYNCKIMRDSSVRWEQLRELNIERSGLSDEAIESILTGSPLLELLEINLCYGADEPIFSSKSLRKMFLLFDEDLYMRIEISCPNLEELKISGSYERTNFIFKDLSSLIYANLDFDEWEDNFDDSEDDQSFAKILQQLQHVEKLTFGSSFTRCLARLEDKAGQFSPLLNIKSLTLDQPDFGKYADGISYALRVSPVLEKLIIKGPVHKNKGRSTKYWDSKLKALNFLLSHLKSVHIVALGRRPNCEVPLGFVDFVLKNAPVLENLVILKDG